MEASNISTSALVVFGLAFACGLAILACLNRLTRRLGLQWNRLALQAAPRDVPRLTKLLWGFERADPALKGLIWTTRGLWVAMVTFILLFAFLLARAA